MAFRSDEEALRRRVDALEDELADARDEADRLREERDRALAGEPAVMPKVRVAPLDEPSASVPVVRAPARSTRWRWLLALALVMGLGMSWLLGADPPPAHTHRIWHASAVHVGESVTVEWSGSWWPAHVLSVHGANVRVRYDGLPTTHDETVSFWRVRAHDLPH
jgi:hypothetical protein